MRTAVDQLVKAWFDRESLREVDVDALHILTVKYPYSPLFHYLYTRKLKEAGDSRYPQAVARTAFYFSNPHWLHHQMQERTERETVRLQENAWELAHQPVPEISSESLAATEHREAAIAEMPGTHETIQPDYYERAEYEAEPATVQETAEAQIPPAVQEYAPLAPEPAGSAEQEEERISVESIPAEGQPSSGDEVEMETEAGAEPPIVLEEEAPAQAAFEGPVAYPDSGLAAAEKASSGISPMNLPEPEPEEAGPAGQVRVMEDILPPAVLSESAEEISLEEQEPDQEYDIPVELTEEELMPASVESSEPVAGQTPDHLAYTEPVVETGPAPEISYQDSEPDIPLHRIEEDLRISETVQDSEMVKAEISELTIAQEPEATGRGPIEPMPYPEAAIPIEPLYTIDYFASQGVRLSAEEESKDQLGKKLKSFTEWLKSMKRIHPERLTQQLDEQTEETIKTAADNSNDLHAVVTETMAEVFVKQGRMESAREIYQKLSLLNPSKSAYFAAKIAEIKDKTL
jgi:hypothetical protein